ncbi:DUF2877 domain-containing protein [Serratia plymuthica]|uniref:DUF2877 domain-containing protein n=1 Tax=Serratia plymuthica TaxID=82996 RepID=UPI0018D8D753|nr:DUF2877 domain-containing protein [Serratia plymuthica]QPS89716.1 DUF2877 domain-containing protein [Serratia plymuthica]
MNIGTLAVSRHVTRDYGQLRCAGRFNNAINFLTEKDHLLTLHRAGHGLSPMGWQIGSGDFDRVLQRLPVAGCGRFSLEGLTLGTITIGLQGRRRNLALSECAEVPMQPLTGVLLPVTAPCGLFGPLGQIVARPLNPELVTLSRCFSRWLQGDEVDWRSVLGKGPGLTPSNDDTLLGMLLIAYLDNRVEVAALQPFFKRTAALGELTSRVSAHYLHYAEQGIFATPLHGLAQGLSMPERLSSAIDEVLRLGHFSGADTLLGVWLGVIAINALY